MSRWWEQLTDSPARSNRGVSVYEQRCADRQREEPSVTIGRFDESVGEVVFEPGWERRVTGWQPLGDLLRGRS